MRRIVGIGGAVVVIAVAAIALLRDADAAPPAGSRRLEGGAHVSTGDGAEHAASPPPVHTAVPAPVAPSRTGAADVDAPPAPDVPATPAAAPALAVAHASPSNPVRGSVLVDDGTPARSPGAVQQAMLSRAAIQGAIKAVTPRVRDCYEQALKIEPTLGGTVKVNFTLEAKDGKGEVTEGEVADSETHSPFFEACVLKEVAGAPFDAPEGGGTVKVTYPFRFASDEGSR